MLGSHIQKLIECHAPDRYELDIASLDSCNEAITRYDPDIIIHAAAWTDVAGAELYRGECWNINVRGTEHIAKAARGKRVVYISTDYVFDGERGQYKEDDIPNPTNFYALTKLAGEIAINQYPHTLVIRTAFKPDGPWPYPMAFTDQWTSHEFISIIAPDIVRAALMESLEGIIHIAGERKSIYDLARRVTPHVGKASIKNLDVRLPRDTSLDSSKWREIASRKEFSGR